jgi:hypothetical protein
MNTLRPFAALVGLTLTGCCHTIGMQWLNSCRAPSVEEMDVVAQCLEAGHKTSTKAYAECLESKGVRYGDIRMPANQ